MLLLLMILYVCREKRQKSEQKDVQRLRRHHIQGECVVGVDGCRWVGVYTVQWETMASTKLVDFLKEAKPLFSATASC